ncbi:hypothetical protein AAFF_G00272000 [Aldrovandia affinis]|uniref:Uncharacterized protein n=1 Tax=Aldrovandia affinis TaxID=143900 RepID=A0AAD7W2P5_9TELE|nr:hypothetical protein AAFF_G00272000 [Aldrovandia affinis]
MFPSEEKIQTCAWNDPRATDTRRRNLGTVIPARVRSCLREEGVYTCRALIGRGYWHALFALTP